jgi:hypothetical protein
MASHHRQSHPFQEHAESLAMSAASAIIVDETRQDPASSNYSPPNSYWESENISSNIDLHNQWGASSVTTSTLHNNNTLQTSANGNSNNIWANNSDSEYMNSASTYSNSTTQNQHYQNHQHQQYPLQQNTVESSSQRLCEECNGDNNDYNKELVGSISRLRISSSSYLNNNSKEFVPSAAASLASMNTATSSIPGIVGVSSGSTGGTGNTIMWKDSNSLKNPYSTSHHYPLQQQHSYQNSQNHHQPLHQHNASMTSDNIGVPVGFLSPLVASRHPETYSNAEDDSISFDSRPSKSKTPFKRRGVGQRGGGRRGGNNNHKYQNNHWRGGKNRHHNYQISPVRDDNDSYSTLNARTTASSKASSEAIRMLIEQPASVTSRSSSQISALRANRLPLERLQDSPPRQQQDSGSPPILPAMEEFYGNPLQLEGSSDNEEEEEWTTTDDRGSSPASKKRDWLLRMNRRMAETPVGEMDPSNIPISAIMNAWAKTKSSKGATNVDMWLKRAQQEFDGGNTKIIPNAKMYTMAGSYLLL